MSTRAARHSTILALTCSLVAAAAHAQLDLGLIVAKSPNTTFRSYTIAGTDRVPVFVQLPESAHDEAVAEGLARLDAGLYGSYKHTSTLASSIARHPGWKWTWSPSRRLLLDRAIPFIHADVARSNFGARGAGVIVGVVDTGIDLAHPDFREADGRTRVAYYLDLTQPAPLGLHPELEAFAGCTAKDAAGEYTSPCAVYSAADINRMLASAQSSTTFPIDAVGHGSHVASLAAGNGFSNVPAKYVGVAPDADLVVVNASRQNIGDIVDYDIIQGAKFVFEVASSKYLNEPAVVNLSLGGDAGGHDGTSMLEKELSALVGPEFPGRSIVVAGGNSADLYDTGSQYPKPIGIHTSVQVLPDGNATRVPILVDSSGAPGSDGIFIAWIQSREGDTLSVGVNSESGECVAPIPPGYAIEERACGDAKISLYNGITDESNDPNGGSKERPAIALLATGKFLKPSVFSLMFKGSGTAFVWVQSQGALTPSYTTLGALVPSATRERTVAIPASASELIAVGATLNRTGWTDVIGTSQKLQRFGSIPNPTVGDVASFSGAGPNQLDEMKPDILAPGGYVVGAMAALADPRSRVGIGSMFDSTGSCRNDDTVDAKCPDNTNECLCYVVDNQHGVAVGTSMASPIVAGAVALLFEQDPTLTQDQVRRYLQAGAQKRWGNLLTYAQEGPGILDVNGALQALTTSVPSNPVYGFASWLTVSTGLVHPDDHWPTRGTLHLRDKFNKPTEVDPSRISIKFTPGFLLSPIKAEGYGYYTFDFTAGSGAGRQTMLVNVSVDNRLVITEQLYIGVDIASARGEVVGGRGCSISNATSPFRSDWGWLGALSAIAFARRRRQ